jgi:hypothetical protein
MSNVKTMSAGLTGLIASLMITSSAFAAMGSSSQGDREVRALNLLEAKGYRHFMTVREHGRQFIVDATRAGKKVTVTINPDNGQITDRT